ncbi:hypothetical protein MFLAVUS_004617 [Mucor flavus]|uniref:Tubby C-terminal domain-containing protein n=1 Tax=Mucor flavus TaxID=439312 RepID=A0ABP9YWE1_9FUNG
MSKSNTGCYTITSIYRESQTAPEGYVELGKVRSNFLVTTFVVYSYGRNSLKREMAIKKKVLPIREELGCYETIQIFLGFKGPRKMTTLMHILTRDGKRSKYRPANESEMLLKTQSFVLNFYRRVAQASVNNFQIDNDLDFIVMQFGRVERDPFTTD